ncbi:MAG: MutS N-terminal domain-containing protein [Candidatus Binataceae bacterium]
MTIEVKVHTPDLFRALSAGGDWSGASHVADGYMMDRRLRNQFEKKVGGQICPPIKSQSDQVISQINGPKTLAEAAAVTGVSRRQVVAAKRVLQHGSPEVFEAVERGDLSLAAATAIIDTIAKEEQGAAVADAIAAPKELDENHPRAACGPHGPKRGGTIMARISLKRWEENNPLEAAPEPESASDKRKEAIEQFTRDSLDARKPSPAEHFEQVFRLLKKMKGGAILIFHLGDFGEMFFEDAVLVAEVLADRWTLTRSSVPLFGVPWPTIERSITKLLNLDLGLSVAVCEPQQPHWTELTWCDGPVLTSSALGMKPGSAR